MSRQVLLGRQVLLPQAVEDKPSRLHGTAWCPFAAASARVEKRWADGG